MEYLQTLLFSCSVWQSSSHCPVCGARDHSGRLLGSLRQFSQHRCTSFIRCCSTYRQPTSGKEATETSVGSVGGAGNQLRVWRLLHAGKTHTQRHTVGRDIRWPGLLAYMISVHVAALCV